MNLKNFLMLVFADYTARTLLLFTIIAVAIIALVIVENSTHAIPIKSTI